MNHHFLTSTPLLTGQRLGSSKLIFVQITVGFRDGNGFAMLLDTHKLLRCMEPYETPCLHSASWCLSPNFYRRRINRTLRSRTSIKDLRSDLESSATAHNSSTAFSTLTILPNYQPIMFSRVAALTALALPLLAAATPLEARGGMPASQCNTGPVQCCNSVQTVCSMVHSLAYPCD